MIQQPPLNQESNYKEKYEAIVFFLYHEYNASLCTFQGLLQVIERKEDPLFEYFQKEFKKYQERAQIIAGLLEDIKVPALSSPSAPA